MKPRARTFDLSLAGGRVSRRVSVRTLAVCALLALLCLVFLMLAVTSGDYGVPLADVARAFSGEGDATVRMIVLEWRLPRALLALLLGSALGMSGAIFQMLTRNPLGSPDIIGFSAGAHTGALIAIVLFSGTYAAVVTGALAGGLGAAFAVYLLAWRGGADGFRLIVVGIGIAAMLTAFNAWMIRNAELQVSMAAALWAAGSLNGLGASRLLSVALAMLVLCPFAVALARPMRQLSLGDEVALASGLNARRVRLSLAALGVALIALSTAAAGPIAFIPLIAPQIARVMIRTAEVSLLPSALSGALLLLAADWAAQHAIGYQLPVGIMTFNIGGLYFLWLLFREGRK